ncbi:MAG: hypothetical protein LBT00_05105 [Spirochaetaceae bacterium]|nr:hypothetical protein [Spirochaetaceae bacterium]
MPCEIEPKARVGDREAVKKRLFGLGVGNCRKDDCLGKSASDFPARPASTVIASKSPVIVNEPPVIANEPPVIAGKPLVIASGAKQSRVRVFSRLDCFTLRVRNDNAIP